VLLRWGEGKRKKKGEPPTTSLDLWALGGCAKEDAKITLFQASLLERACLIQLVVLVGTTQAFLLLLTELRPRRSAGGDPRQGCSGDTAGGRKEEAVSGEAERSAHLDCSSRGRIWFFRDTITILLKRKGLNFESYLKVQTLISIYL